MTDELNRLRLACRRGMWELDLLFEAFLDCGYQALSDNQKKQFQQFLECDDPDLFSWLMAESEPHSKEFKELVYLIKSHAKKDLF